MKRPWSEEGNDGSSSDESSNSESDKESTAKTKGKAQPKGSDSKVKFGKRKSGAVDFEALMQRGYRGGPSVLKVPAPKESDGDRDWTWSTGKEKEREREREESYEERQKTRAALAEGEELVGKQTRREKEKRKREGGKNYVEEEKRLLRDSGVYSGYCFPHVYNIRDSIICPFDFKPSKSCDYCIVEAVWFFKSDRYIDRIVSGVVLQQPPTREAPASIHLFTYDTKSSSETPVFCCDTAMEFKL